MFKPEILAPGGSFNSSIHAFEAGADAVYLGMSSFSARKGAKNFSIDSLRRLKSYTEEHQKKIFVAINTVLKDEELPEIISLLHHLSLIDIDGIILQDPGLALIIKEFFPRMVIHASTQMAVHNSKGVQILKEEGFKRIILARELTLEEIGAIREEHRDVELEVFIHGAMCYSFSGLCLASGTMLGRSGNRGECGQICRTWFGKGAYNFSANDMKAGTLVKDLQKLGIDSLKIEGRLKSPEYVSHTVSYYRALIDGQNTAVIEKEEQLSSLSFSRNQTRAFFQSPKGEKMINSQYASHTGISAGKILTAEKGKFLMRAETELSDRDGLLLLKGKEKFQFALKSEGKKNTYSAGETISIIFNGPVGKGDRVYKVSGHDMQLKEFKEESRKPWKTPVSVKVELKEAEITLSTLIAGQTIILTESMTLEKSTGGKNIQEILNENLRKSGTSIFAISGISVENNSNLQDREIFIPLSALKSVKKAFYEKMENSFEKIITSSQDEILHYINRKLDENPYGTKDFKIPSRSKINPHGGLIPFVLESFSHPGSQVFYPLPPVMLHQKDFAAVENDIDLISSDKTRTIIVGINNISHLYFTRRFRETENVWFFTDYCSYIANRSTQLYYRKRIEKLLFSYYWIEDKKGQMANLRKIEPDFNPHLFVSRICYKLHNNLGKCKNCSKDLSYHLHQRDKEFTVLVKNCFTWLFQN